MVQQPDDSASASESSAEESDLAAYDLNEDGKISAVEDIRAQLGVIDARLEDIADEGGVKGKIADAAHHIVDRLDND